MGNNHRAISLLADRYWYNQMLMIARRQQQLELIRSAMRQQEDSPVAASTVEVTPHVQVTPQVVELTPRVDVHEPVVHHRIVEGQPMSDAGNSRFNTGLLTLLLMIGSALGVIGMIVLIIFGVILAGALGGGGGGAGVTPVP